MHTYQILIPYNRNPDSRNNPGKSYLVEIGRWEDYLLGQFGGYTRLQTVHGAWRDPKTGTVYREEMVPYHLALANQWDIERVTKRALQLFDDQKAIYATSLGVSHIFEREQEVA